MTPRASLRRASLLLGLLFAAAAGLRLEAAPPADGVVVFNELMYNPASSGELGEWIELHNQMGVSVDLSDWRIEGGINFAIPDGTIISGGAYLVIARTESMFPGALSPFSGNLANSGETLRLVDNNGRLMDEVSYGDSDGWPVAADGSGVSLAKRDPHLASSAEKNWSISSQLYGSPGAANFPPPPAPRTTRVIGTADPWRYDNSGAPAAADWNALVFDDSNWNSGEAAFSFGNVTLYEPAPSTAPYRANLTSAFHTGVNATHGLAAFGTGDLHYTNVATGQPAIVESGHPAWLGPDGVSQWIGLTANGTDNVAVGQFTYRTTLDFTGFDPATADIKVFVSVDNSLDNVRLNGTNKNLTAAGFGSFLGPFTITGPFNAGVNTVDFIWSNAGTTTNPAGLRLKWDAKAAPRLARTTLPANPVTTYFRRKFVYNAAPGSSHRLMLNYVVDDGAVFYLNGTELHRVNVETGPTSHLTTAGNEILFPRFSGELELPADALISGENVLAVELHQSSVGNADAFFLTSLETIETFAQTSASTVALNEVAAAAATNFFIELQNSGAQTVALDGYRLRSSSGASFTFAPGATLAAGALLALDQTALGFRPAQSDKLFLYMPGDSAVVDAAIVETHAQARGPDGAWLTPSGSTPGNVNAFDLNTGVVINEIMYHHAPQFLPTGATDSTEEWVELYNRSAAPVDLTGWKVRGGITFDFAPGTVLPPAAYLVVANDAPALAAKFPGVPVIGNFNGTLANSDDFVRLEDARGNPVDEVHYFDHGRWDERADGGGSSLELRDPAMDNSVAEAWAASDESAKASWQNFSYEGRATTYPGSNEPNAYHELIVGLLNAGEFLIDDISVKEVSVGNRELIQNGAFATGAASSWRLLGTHGSHGRSVIVDDPASGGNKVLKVVATGPAEHMHNHVETTLKSGASYVPIISGNTYNISFRARWIRGTPRLQTRLYFNRLVRQFILPMPANTGTPGAPNSRRISNAGPAFADLGHAPLLPPPGNAVTVRIAANDPDGIAELTLHWRQDGGGWNPVAMSLNNDHYEAVIPAQSAGALAQFYIEGRDNRGALSTFPASGPASRALIRWSPASPQPTPGHGIRILMTTADANFLHLSTNVMSNDTIPCTVLYRGSDVFYDAQVRLRSSERGRLGDVRLGFSLFFDPTHKFRGTHESVNLDRSGYGRGTTGNGYGQSEIISWHFFNRAGGIPSMYNDLVYLTAPRSIHNGSAMLTMAEFNDGYLESQYANGASTPTFKYELIYYPTTTTGGPEGLKIPQPDSVVGVEIGQINSPDKEAYRWNFLIGNARDADDYSRIINLNSAFRLTGAPYAAALPGAIDIDQWLRTAAALALAGIGDNYATSSGAWHNLKLYHRADGRILYLPWDLDFQDRPSNDPLIINPDISALLAANSTNQRIFYGHFDDIINTSFNAAYLGFWTNHYQTFTTTGGNWNDIINYVNARIAFVRGQINSAYPRVTFAITTNGGADFTTPGSNAALAGDGWINVRTIRVRGSGLVLTATWTDRDSWVLTVPTAPGPNVFILEALDFQGNVVGTDSITITGTGTIPPAAAGNLVVSELHYNPRAPSAAEQAAGYLDNDDFEFIELRNIGAFAVNLAGVRLTGGVEYAFSNTTVPAGATVVVPRRANAFAMRYPGVITAPDYFQPGANLLENSGEQIAVIAASGADIQRFNYGDALPWPREPDGDGPSLVLIAPHLNPDPREPLHWRSSTSSDGNPAGSDALPLPADPMNDDDGDGVLNVVKYAMGAGARPATAVELVGVAPFLALTVEREPRADVQWIFEASADLRTWSATGAAMTPIERTILASGVERITLRSITPLTTASQFLRARLRTAP